MRRSAHLDLSPKTGLLWAIRVENSLFLVVWKCCVRRDFQKTQGHHLSLFSREAHRSLEFTLPQPRLIRRDTLWSSKAPRLRTSVSITWVMQTCTQTSRDDTGFTSRYLQGLGVPNNIGSTISIFLQRTKSAEENGIKLMLTKSILRLCQG